MELANPSPSAGMSQPPNLTDKEWEELYRRLTLYAAWKVARLAWRGGNGSTPGAKDAADFAAEAIAHTLEGRRSWNREKTHDFFEHLKGVVDSRVSALANSTENKRSTQLEHDGINEPLIPHRARGPQAEVADREDSERFRSAVFKEIEGDELAQKIVECIDANITKPAEMAVVLERDVLEVNNGQKRLRRAVNKAMTALGRRSGR